MNGAGALAASIATLTVAAGVAGCVYRDAYPDYWPPLTTAPDGSCPDISGRYRNAALQTGLCDPDHVKYDAEWDCDLRLDRALNAPVYAAASDWVEIRQPDPDEIVVATTAESRTLRRSAGDFDCDDEGIEVSTHASIFAKRDSGAATDAYITTIELLVASGGVSSLTLHFRRAADGSLVAKLSESSTGLLLAIPVHVSELHYLRWGTWTEEPAPP